MRNAGSILASAWYDKLSDLGLTIDGRVLTAGNGIYDGVAPDTEKGSYILVGERSTQQQQDKAGYTFDANILIDIVVKNGSFGYQTGDDLASTILAAVNSDTQLNLSPYFQCISTEVSNYFNLPSLNPTEPTFRTLIRYSHALTQVS